MRLILPIILLCTQFSPILLAEELDLPKAAISIATAFGQPIPEVSPRDIGDDHIVEVGLGQQVVIGSEQSKGTLLWIIDPPTVAVTSFPDGSTQILTTPTEPATISVLQIAATSNDEDFKKSIRFARVRYLIRVGGWKPGPTPNPQPSPNPTPIAQRSVRVSLLSDASKAAKEETIIRNSTQFWNSLKLRGNDWIFFDTLDQTERSKRLISAAATAKIIPPVLIFEDVSTAEIKVLSVIPLPKDFDTIEAELKKVGGK